MNKYEKFALKRNLLSITAYSIVALLTIYLLVDLMKEVYGGGKPGIWLCIIALLYLSLYFLMLAKLKNSDDWLDCIKKAEEGAREKYTGMPAIPRKEITYEIIKILYPVEEETKNTDVMVLALMIEIDKDFDSTKNTSSYPPIDKARVYAFECSITQFIGLITWTTIKISNDGKIIMIN